MSRPNAAAILRDLVLYVRRHPEEAARVLKGVLGLKLGLPIDALRYLAKAFGGGKKAPRDVSLEAVPPGLRVGFTVDAMGAPIKVSMIVEIRDVIASAEELRLVVAISALDVKGDASSPVGALLSSGAIDLSKPGNLVSFLPKKPPFLVDAKDDTVTLDLLRVPALSKNDKVLAGLRVLAPVLGIRGVRTSGDHLDVQLSASLSRLSETIKAARESINLL